MAGSGQPYPFFVSCGRKPASLRLFAWALRRLRLALSAAARRAGREGGGLPGLMGGLAMAEAMRQPTLGSRAGGRGLCGAVLESRYTGLFGAMGAAAYPALAVFQPVADDPAVAVRSVRCEGRDSTFETVESHGAAGLHDLKGFIVITAANIGFCHDTPPRINRPSGDDNEEGTSRVPNPLDRSGFRRHKPARRCRSSVVEHSLGKGEVDSSILSGSTIVSPL
jgi:hypothetical protein